jgi:4-amino-4-deoxy-L-arabinose transferase-like glycosyltransferase
MRSPLERAALGAGLALAAVGSCLRNLSAGPVTFDEDEVEYWMLAEAVARRIHALDPLGAARELVGNYRPPLTVLTDAATMLLMPPDPALLALTRLGWLLVMLAAVGVLAREVAARAGAPEATQARAGFLGVILAGTAPAVLQLTPSLLSEIPLAAVVAWSLVLLLRAQADPTDARAAWLGVALGAALLVKWTAPLTLAPAALAALLVGPGRSGRLRVAALAGGVALAVALPWYGLAGGRVAAFVLEVGTGEGAQAFGATERAGLAEALWYGPVVLGGLLWLPVAGVALWGAATARRAPGATVLLAGIVGPIVLFSLLANKEIRYLLPIVPAWAALAGVGLARRLGPRAVLGWVAVAVVGALPGLITRTEAPAGRATRADEPAVWGVPLLPRSSPAFPYRDRVAAGVPLDAVDDAVQGANPGGPRTAVVLSPSPWLRTPLWARAARSRGWTTWRSAACDPGAVPRASWILTLEPPDAMAHCAALTDEARARFERLRPTLVLAGAWEWGGRSLRLYENPARRRGEPLPAEME